MDERNEVVVSAPEGAVLQYGGQAVIEGVMMRSARYFAVACRKPDGTIVTQREEVDKSIIGKLKWLNKPFLRGTLALVDAMALGTRALAFASNIQMEAEYTRQQAGKKPTPGVPQQPPTPLQEEVVAISASLAQGTPVVVPEKTPSKSKINDIAIGGTIVSSFVFGIGLFVLVPTLLTGFLHRHGLVSAANPHAATTLNLVDGLIRMILFFGYIALISFMPQIQRVFQYHGAEHKAINTLEAGLPLSGANALRASRIHPRCGTSFIFIVLVINLLVFAVLPRPVWYLRFPMHLAVIPLVAGIAYEVIKFAGKYRRYPLVMAVFAPGMATQLLTTREPDADQVEVALAALYAVLEAEGHLRPADLSAATPDPEEPAAALA